jgi:hypothetical protein
MKFLAEEGKIYINKHQNPWRSEDLLLQKQFTTDDNDGSINKCPIP